MKTLKFKIWDLKNKRWAITKENEEMAIDNEGHIFIRDYEGINYVVEDEFEIVLGTGVKDKNGKEIYNNDILYVRSDLINGECVVEYNNGCFKLRNVPICNFRSECLNIIGNVYENNLTRSKK